ncbi:MAG: hypothetical protein ACI835_003165 [Planctomycetota bacterium]|jgi:hypothetical protein
MRDPRFVCRGVVASPDLDRSNDLRSRKATGRSAREVDWGGHKRTTLRHTHTYGAALGTSAQLDPDLIGPGTWHQSGTWFEGVGLLDSAPRRSADACILVAPSILKAASAHGKLRARVAPKPGVDRWQGKDGGRCTSACVGSTRAEPSELPRPVGSPLTTERPSRRSPTTATRRSPTPSRMKAIAATSGRC